MATWEVKTNGEYGRHTYTVEAAGWVQVDDAFVARDAESNIVAFAPVWSTISITRMREAAALKNPGPPPNPSPLQPQRS